MPHDVQDAARRRLSALAQKPQEEESAARQAPAHRLRHDAALVGRLFAAAGDDETGDDRATGAAAGDAGAALSLLEDMRTALDELEAQVVMEARRRGLDWRQIAHHRGLNSSQAASQRYQRLVTRLEEIRQGVR